MSDGGKSPPPPRILAFLKAPRPGSVKTRLAAAYGAEEAARIYRQLVARQLEALPKGWPVEIHFAPRDGGPEVVRWLGLGFYYVGQAEGDLGERLGTGVGIAFAKGAGSVVCIGGDCPDLGADDFIRARTLLEAGHDLVFGPATDGGYYLVAMRKPCPEIFEGVPWSSDRTFEVSLAKARAAGRRIALLDPKSDIDEPEDWERWSSGEG